MPNALDSMPRSLQDLPPKWAHFCLDVEKFITGDLGVTLTDKTIVTAFSGGVDSTALLLVLYYLSQKNNCRLVAVHLNHQIRPEAHADAQWVQSFCKQLKTECIIESAQITEIAKQDGIGLEEAGRNARYSLFSQVLQSHHGDLVAVGHHLDDLAEDVLMRLVRGTGWPGLSGMPGHDKVRHLIRPFLLIPKVTLTQFLTDIGVSWRVDQSNEDTRWTRNRVRHSILPLFLEENPNFMESVARLWKIGSIDTAYWEEQTADIQNMVPEAALRNAHKAKRLRLYKAALETMEGSQALAETLFKLDTAWQEKRTGATFQFPAKITATITHSGVVFSAKH